VANPGGPQRRAEKGKSVLVQVITKASWNEGLGMESEAWKDFSEQDWDSVHKVKLMVFKKVNVRKYESFLNG
jgi:hypothetical protein